MEKFAIKLTHEQDGAMKLQGDPALNHYGPFPVKSFAEAAIFERGWVPDDLQKDTWVLRLGENRLLYAEIVRIADGVVVSYGDKHDIPMRIVATA
jgi:hypothetical protein